MKLQFRAAALSDIADITTLIDASYAPQVRRLYGDSARGRWSHYDGDRVRTYIGREGEGVRLGFNDDRLLSVCVCRGYGSIGWLHSLGVHPDVQHRGLGRQVVEDAQIFFVRRGVRITGLMTWPDAVGNIGFYQHLGYRPVGLSLYAYRLSLSALVFGRAPVSAEFLSQAAGHDRHRAFDSIQNLGNELAAGLDYREWAQWTQQQNYGDTLLLWRDHRLVALALAYYGRPPADWLEGKLLLVSPAATSEDVIWTLEMIRRWAVERGCSSFGFPVDVTQPEVSEWCNRFGFRLFGDSMLNLVRGGPWPPQGIHLVRFSG